MEKFFEQFGGKKPSDAPLEATVHDIKRKKPYFAADIDKDDERVRRLRLCFNDGNTKLLSYVYLANATVNGRANYMTLVFSIGVVEIIGRNLDKLLDAMQDEHIRVLRYFDSEQHDMPVSGEPFIETIQMLPDNDDDIIEKS